MLIVVCFFAFSSDSSTFCPGLTATNSDIDTDCSPFGSILDCDELNGVASILLLITKVDFILISLSVKLSIIIFPPVLVILIFLSLYSSSVFATVFFRTHNTWSYF